MIVTRVPPSALQNIRDPRRKPQTLHQLLKTLQCFPPMSMREEDEGAVIHKDEQGPYWVQKEVCPPTYTPPTKPYIINRHWVPY